MQTPSEAPRHTVAQASPLGQLSSIMIGFRSAERQVTLEGVTEEGVSRQATDTQLVQQNIEQAFMQHFSTPIRVFALVFLFVVIMQMGLFIWLAVAFMLEGNNCDGPVTRWVWVLCWINILNSTINRNQGSVVQRVLCCFTQDPVVPRPVPKRVLVWEIFSRFVLPFVWNCLGVEVISKDARSEHPCGSSQPSLFLAARVYSIFALACSVVGLLGVLGIATLLRHAMRHGLLRTCSRASPRVIENCKVVPLSGVDLQKHSSCSICWDEYCDGKPIVNTACGHFFHKQCLGNWLQLDKTCPLCRQDLEASSVSSVSVGSGLQA